MKRSIFSLALSIAMLFTIVYCANMEAYAAEPYSKICSDEEWEVLKLTNKRRLENGLEPLSTFSKLQSASQLRSKEIKDYFSHTRPNGESCFSVLQGKGIKYFSAGENIAAGQSSPKSVMESWWNSSGHKANILTEYYSHLGAGYASGGKYGKNWVQMFIGGCKTEAISINSASSIKSYKKGTTIEAMGRYVTVKCDMHGTSYMPLTDKMCTGYNKNKTGTQNIKVSYDGCSTSFKVLIGNTKPGKVTSLKASKISKKSVTLSWKKVSNATGYEIYRSESKNGKYKKTAAIKKNSTVKYTNKSLKANKKYYYKVRAYNKTNNVKVYGSFSNVLSVKTAKK